jgi:hypothetical protein
VDFETIKSVFAVIGACATAGGLGWRVYTWRHGRATRIAVRISNALPTYGPNNEPGEWSFQIQAINNSDHVVRVTSVGLTLPDGRDVGRFRSHSPSRCRRRFTHAIRP